jgi:hypothetical protein
MRKPKLYYVYDKISDILHAYTKKSKNKSDHTNKFVNSYVSLKLDQIYNKTVGFTVKNFKTLIKSDTNIEIPGFKIDLYKDITKLIMDDQLFKY